MAGDSATHCPSTFTAYMTVSGVQTQIRSATTVSVKHASPVFIGPTGTLQPSAFILHPSLRAPHHCHRPPAPHLHRSPAQQPRLPPRSSRSSALPPPAPDPAPRAAPPRRLCHPL